MLHRRPPPCDLQSPRVCANLEQPSFLHREPPPCSGHLPRLSADLLQSGTLHTLPLWRLQNPAERRRLGQSGYEHRNCFFSELVSLAALSAPLLMLLLALMLSLLLFAFLFFSGGIVSIGSGPGGRRQDVMNCGPVGREEKWCC